MIKFILSNGKTIIIVAIIIAALTVFGNIVNDLIPWIWLTYFFSLIQWSLGFIDMFWDTTTMITLVGIELAIFVAYWTLKGTLLVIHWFKD